MNTPHTTARRQRGITLVEGAIVAAIGAVLVGMAVPNLGDSIERRHLEGAAALLETDLQLARSEAVARSTVVRVDFEAGAGASCYVMHTGSAGDCRCLEGAAPVCRPSVQPLRSVHYGADRPVALASNSASMAFEPVTGTVTPTATIRVTARSGAELHQVINIMGRVRSCSSTGVPGYKAC